MGCGCGKSASARAAAKQMAVNPPISVAPQQNFQQPVTNPNNMRAMNAETSLPPPDGMTEADRRRIQKLRQQAIQKSLGKLS